MTSADANIPNPLDEIPPLTTSVLTTDESQVAALRLIADSIAQQRQLASRALIFHPAVIATYLAVLAITYQILYRNSDQLGVLITTVSGITMIALVAVRGVTSGYITQAEEFNWEFTKNEDGENDIVLGTQFGDAIIGAAILRLEPNSTKKKKAGGKGVVRAWTVKMRYRGTGVGTDLLQEAVKISRERLGNSAEIGFAAEHAHSKMVLPEMFNGTFRKKEARAAKALKAVVEGSKKK
jgi:hypothetical protein